MKGIPVVAPSMETSGVGIVATSDIVTSATRRGSCSKERGHAMRMCETRTWGTEGATIRVPCIFLTAAWNRPENLGLGSVEGGGTPNSELWQVEWTARERGSTVAGPKSAEIILGVGRALL
jgi:hypothetical protein